MGLQLSRWSNRRFGVLLVEQLYGNANAGKPAPDPLGHARLSALPVAVSASLTSLNLARWRLSYILDRTAGGFSRPRRQSC
jgi:hypothetical protein